MTAMFTLVVLLSILNLSYLSAVPFESRASLPINIAAAIYRRLELGDGVAAEGAVSGVLLVFTVGSILIQTYACATVLCEVMAR